MPRTRSATILALSWQCQWCSHSNNSFKNKKHCCSCLAWRDRIAPLSTRMHGNMFNKAGGIDDVGLLVCSSKNGSPNKASPCKVERRPEKSGERRKSPSQGNGSVAIQPLLLTWLPLTLWPKHRTIMPNLPLQYRGIYDGFFGKAFSFAVKTMHHTANQLQQWEMEPDLGVKSFPDSILFMPRSICLPYHRVLPHRAHNPCNGFVSRAISCTWNCSNGKHCSQCASKINTVSR